MRKILLSMAAVLVLLVLLGWAALATLGVSPVHLGQTIQVANGLGAKLACSARHVSGFSEAQAALDLTSYSPALSSTELQFEDEKVTAGLFGFSAVSATWRPGIGCTLERGNADGVDQIAFDRPASREGLSWPAGASVTTIDPVVQANLDDLLAADNEAGLQTRAFVIVRNGEVIAESYAPGLDTDTPILGWSMGKSVTAMLLGYLENEGLVDESETSLFPSWAEDGRAAISLKQMLQMSSGLAFNEVYAPPSDSTQMLFVEPSASDYAMRSPLIHEPGEHFAYSSGTANLLARLVVDRLGGPGEAYASIFDGFVSPLGITTLYLEPDASGTFVGSSYVFASGRDWARLGLVMLNDGVLNGARVLPPGWAARATAPNTSGNDPRYGYQFWLNSGGESRRWEQLPEDAYAMNGNRAQSVMMIPSKDVVLVRLGWTAGRYPMGQNMAAMLSWVDAF